MGDIEVMPWLQEAIQTINVLEARLVELEEDCKVFVQKKKNIPPCSRVTHTTQSWLHPLGRLH
jgi:hypothetical protein